MSRVDLEQVTKVFPGGVKAVDGVDLAVADREFVVLVGPSGCGKSTTLRMIAGLEEVTSGTIGIGGRVVNDVPPKDRDIAMVFQNYALYPHMTVYKNMAFALKLRKVPKAQIQHRVLEAATLLEIEHLLERKPRELSGGQRQRVAVGRAIVREPAAFLFDEPLSNLDAKLRVTTRAELKRLHQRLRTTTVYVTHDQEEAMTLGDRIVVMKDGVIQQAAPPLETYHSPANRFVAGFIGMPPMNFFDGLVSPGETGASFREGKVGAKVATKGDETRPGELTLPPNGFTLPIPARRLDKLAGSVGRHVVLGIRPEHLYLTPLPNGDSSPLDLRVSVIEPLGSMMDVYMTTELDNPVVGRVDALGASLGAAGVYPRAEARVTVHVDLRRVHVFEPGVAGMNLSKTSEPIHALA